MSVQVEKLEKNTAKLTIEVAAEELEKALQAAYNKQKKDISMPGFRKGKVPRNMIEKMYGPGVFYEEAANMLISQNYYQAATECGEDIVSRPEIDVEQIEKGKPFIFTAVVATKPEVTLGEYKGVAVTKADTTVTDEDVMKAIDKERENNSRQVTVEDRAIEDGDTAVIDFEGFVDGVAFEGGKGENHSLVIGSGSFIPGFEEQLVGKNTGDEVEVNVTFPEDYHSEDLAGKAATFQCKIHEVKTKIVPELDDEFAQDVSEFDTVDEYKDSVAAKLVKEKADSAKAAQQQEALDKVIEASQMELPDAMIATQADTMINQFAQQLASQGLPMEQYLQYSGITVDQLREQVRPEAEQQIKRDLVLEAIAKAENVEITDEDINAELEKMAGMYQMTVDQLKGMMNSDFAADMKIDLEVRRAMEIIGENMDVCLDPVVEEEATEE